MDDPRRLALQKALEAILGSRNVYFQPPASVHMKYPAIVFNLDRMRVRNADNIAYTHRKQYSVTVIGYDPDEDWPSIMLDNFPYCSFERWYAADNLNHWQFALYW